MADAILNEDIRELLAKTIPESHPQLFQLLGRLSTPAQNLAVYERINRLLHGPAGKVLLGSKTIVSASKSTVAQASLNAVSESV
jgi:hypothetical protein